MISDFLHRRELARIGRDVGDKLDAHPRVQRIAFDDVKVPMQIYCYQDFMTPGECAELIRMIDADAIPSELYRAGAGADQNDFRTSYSCNLDRWHPDVLRIDDRICGLTGIDSRRGETLQGQRYAVGQEFKAHTDYFEPQGQDFTRYTTVGGQRTWTFMIYLNEPEAGGATRFKTIDKSIRPEIGKLVAWNNRRPDGSCNPATIHHGMKVREGTKYVLTKWYRERPWRL